MGTVQDNTSKTQTPKWEVHGQFEFSPDGKLSERVTTTVYVDAIGASDAARQAIEIMGANASIKKVFQMWGEGENE